MRDYASATSRRVAVNDESLRRFFVQMFTLMAAALSVTATVSYAIANTGLMQLLYHVDAARHVQLTGYWWGAAIAQIVLVIAIGAPKNFTRADAAPGYLMLGALSVLVAITIAPVMYAYTPASITKTFFVTAGMFGAAALYGHTTKANLSGWGGFLFMGLVGLIIAMVVNMFLASPMIDFVVSVIGVGLFLALTAWDMQMFKSFHDEFGPCPGLVVNGALALYLDFLNLFLFLLRFLGVPRTGSN